jgi:uncharacterized surface protein with fasciclin (FAS1) repeats
MKIYLYRYFLGTVLGGMLLLTPSVYAKYCPKCVKIETARADEQAKNGPREDVYYDDFKVTAEAKEIKEIRNEEVMPPSSPKSAAENVVDLPTHASNLISNQVSTIADVLAIRNLFSTFEGPFTLFVPSDQAVQNFSMETFMNMLKPDNRELLYSLITNHVVPEQILRGNFNKQFKTLGGRIVELSANGNELTVNGAKVLKSEPIGNAGVVYVIDQVFIPIYSKE